MASKPLPTAGWLLTTAIAFGLGWVLKPAPDPPGGGDGLASGSGSGASAVDPSDERREWRGPGGEWAAGGDDAADGLGRSSRPLGSDAIARLGQRFKNELDPIRRRALFGQLLEGLTAENALEIRAFVAHLGAGNPEFREFHYAWGKVGGADAVLHGAETKESDMTATLAGWASADPAAAMEWFAGLEEKADGEGHFANRNYLKMGMVHGLSNTDPERAAAFVFQLAEAGDKGAEGMLGIVTGKMLRLHGPAGAATWAEGLPDGPLRASALGHVGREFAKADPAAAVAWAEPFLDEAGGARLIHGLSSEWAKRDGAGAVAWLSSLGEGAETARAFHSAFAGWTGKDPLAASQYLVDMPASPQRDHAISGLVNRFRWEDPAAAVEWAGDISDEGFRDKMVIEAGQAYLHREPEAALRWLAHSGLAEEIQQKILRQRR